MKKKEIDVDEIKKQVMASTKIAAAIKKEHGVDVKDVKLNLSQMMKRKDKVVSDLTGGISYLFDKNNYFL